MSQTREKPTKPEEKRRHRSVAEMVRALSEDSDFADRIEKHLEERNILDHLMALRTSLGMSQQDVAAKMKCTQSRLSKLENGRDDDLRIGDFHAYAEALGLRLGIILGKKEQPPIAERINYHFSALKRLFTELTDLVGHDEAMAKGVCKLALKVIRDTAIGIADLLKHVAQKLPRPRSDVAAPIQIELQEEELEAVYGDDPPQCRAEGSLTTPCQAASGR